MKIKVTNPYYDKEYFVDASIERWKNFMENHKRGNEQFFDFTDVATGQEVTINPSFFASVEVTAESERKNYRIWHTQKFNGETLEDSFIKYNATVKEAEEAVSAVFTDQHVINAWYEEVVEK